VDRADKANDTKRARKPPVTLWAAIWSMSLKFWMLGAAGGGAIILKGHIKRKEPDARPGRQPPEETES